MPKFIEWHDQADQHDDDGRPDVSVRWHGGLTFQVWCDGQQVDAFTRHGADGESTPTLREAYEHAAAILAGQVAPQDWSAGEWPGAYDHHALLMQVRRLAAAYERAGYERGASATRSDRSPEDRREHAEVVAKHEAAADAFTAYCDAQQYGVTPESD